jgi:hypothetical protein
MNFGTFTTAAWCCTDPGPEAAHPTHPGGLVGEADGPMAADDMTFASMAESLYANTVGVGNIQHQAGESVTMTNTVEKTTEVPEGTELADEVHESAKTGQHAASHALRKFRHAVDEAVPESVQPLRNKIVDAALELADDLVTAQYNFHRSLLKTADRALTKSDSEQN